MELPKGYSTPNQWIPVTSDSVRMKKTSNLHEIMKRNAGNCNNHSQMGILGFNGDELGQVPFGQLLEANDPARGTFGSFASHYWVGAGGCAGSGQTNRVDGVISTPFDSSSNTVEDLNYLFTDRVDHINTHFNANANAIANALVNQVPLTYPGDAYNRHLLSNGLDTRYIYTQAGTLGHSNVDWKSIESSQEFVNGSIQPTLEPAFQCNSHMSVLPNLNSLPENVIPGTSVSNIMTVPPTPLNVDKFRRNINQNYMPLEIVDLESETAGNQISQHFFNQGESSQTITSQQKDIGRNVVVNGSEGHGENNTTDLNSTPQPKTKRKKHRPKVVREGKPVKPPKASTPNPTDGNEPTPRKRKYTRKKGIDAQATSATSVVGNVDTIPQTNNKYVRRSLKFDEPRSQEAIGSNMAGPEIREAEKTVHGFDLNVSLNQFGSQNVTFPPYPHQSQTLQHEAIGRRENDFTGMMNGTTSSVDNGKDINRLARTINDQEKKRDSDHVSNSLNESCNDLHKRRRTEDTLNTCSSRTSIQNGSNIESTFADIQRIMAFQNMQSSMNMMANQMASRVQAPIAVGCLNVSDNGTHVRASNLINSHKFSSPDTISNHVQGPNMMSFNNPNAVNCHKVSSTSTINNEVPCLQETSTSEKATQIHINSGTNHEACRPKAHVEAVTANQVKLKTRTPRKKESPRITSKPTNGKQVENIVPNTQLGLARAPNNNYKPSGVLITYKDPISALARKLEQLSINDDVDSVTPNLENALVPYANGDRAMVAFVNPLEFLKKKKPRPKVDLDPESNRVWKLLMGLEDDEEKDVNKEKWWEEERRLFFGRAESFISRMKLIQGDRRFSPWKGSVVDSVIGVFLTQNVSDHLSSSAFMCLAARFPLQAKDDNRTKGLEIASSPINILDEDYNGDELKKIGPDELNNKKSQEIILNFNETELGLGRKSPDSVLATSIISPSSTNEDEFHCILSSPNSSESSKTCSDCPDQAFNPNGLNPLSNFEAAELLTGSRGNGYNSFTELLQMANDRVLRSNPQVPFNNNQVDCSSFQDSFKDSGFGGNLYTKQVNTSRVNESTVHGDQLKRTNMINSEAQEEISNKPGVSISSKGNKAPKVQAKKRKSSEPSDWDSLRKNVCKNIDKKMRRSNAIDSLDYEALRQADVKDISYAIRERGMNNMLAERMKAFLNRLVEDHGSIDLEWLRDVPPEKAKDYLLSIRGLGLKSVECVRLLTLHHLAFPVDTNVGRIAVRLGWVPLQPLPESLQLHLLEMYPMLETIQKYLWPRLCKLDQGTLYELHYHLITFGKVFCTKSKPNCNSCPMRGECKHFASAFASARLALPGPEEKRIVTSSTRLSSEKMPTPNPLPQFEPSTIPQILGPQIQNICRNSEPIIEEPASPEPENLDSLENDIEDAFLYDDPDEIPTIRLNIEEFTENLQEYMKANNMAIQDGDLSKALVTIDSEAASIPMPKLKNVSRLRTEHLVYELPDSHPLLEGFDRREPDDPTKYLLAIWTPGETAQSIEAPKACSSSPESGNMCGMSTCFSCNSIREAQTQTVRGTILIPCRTANRGSFPLNGTYFQINEVFADHASSCNPIDVPRDWIWKLERRTVYFGTSVTSIFRGLTTEAIQLCFRRGFVCVRGYDRKTRSPKPLFARLHFTASKAAKTKKQDNERSK